MSEDRADAIQEYEYKAEMQQLLYLIVNSLYTHPEVFLRELISNASDALNKVRFRQLTDKNILNPEAPLRISIRLDDKEQYFEIEDAGIGMTREELVERLGTVASSGTLQFLEQAAKEGKPVDADLIGQFGVGFYSAFMVAEEITVETRHADPGSKACIWKSDGKGKFTIEDSLRENRGTRISFKLKDEHKDFANAYRVRGIIEKYSNFVDFPIYLDKDQVNTVGCLWQKSKSEITDDELKEFYKFVSNDFQDPLGHLHLSMEGAVNFKALVFLPETAPPAFFREEVEKSLYLYSNRIFIQDNCTELLPEYLRFARGVVDTEDLPLNVSREVTQSSPVMRKIRDILTGKILGLLEEWAKDDDEKYEKFCRNFGPLFKTGINSELKHRDRLLDLLRYESTRTESGKLTSLKAYVEGMGEGQSEIYYMLGEHRAVAESSPNLEYFKKNNIEVLFLLDPVDAFVITGIQEYDGKPLKTIEKADIEIKQEENGEDTLAADAKERLLSAFKDTLGERVEDVVESRRLVDSAATLVVGEEGMDAQTEKMMKMLNQEFSSAKKILEVNTRHPLLRNIARLQGEEGKEDVVKTCIQQLFEGAQLLDGNLESTNEFINRMTDLMVQATR